MTGRQQKAFRLPAQLIDKMDQAWRQAGYSSENEWAQKSFEHYLKCSKADEVHDWKMILLKYATRCMRSKCKRELPVETWALWAKGVGVVCMDCYATKIGDRATATLFLKIKKLRWQKKSLLNELDQIGDKLENYAFYQGLQDMFEGNKRIRQLVMEYLKQGFKDSKREQMVLDEIDRLSEEQLAMLPIVETFLHDHPLQKRKKKQKKKQEA